MLLPFVAHEPVLPALLAFGLAFITYLPHKLNRRMYWFQDPENIYDVDFTLSWGLIILFTWYIDRSFWLGVIPVLFMAYGDGITGLIRNLKYNKRTKAWEGTAGMLLLCIIIGAKMGFAGIFAGILCSLVERLENIDDNITVPATGLFILLAAHYYIPCSYCPSLLIFHQTGIFWLPVFLNYLTFLASPFSASFCSSSSCPASHF